MTTAYEDLPKLTPEGAANMGKLVINKGDCGTGKSTLAYQFPKPVCVAYADKDMETVGDAIIEHPGVIVSLIRNWKDYDDVFVPAVKNRKIEARTIVVDTVDSVSVLCAKDIRGSKANLSIPDWGVLADRMWDTTSDLVGAAIPKGDHPGYHIVFNSHLKPITTDIYDDKSKVIGTALVGYQCAIEGKKFSPLIEGFFDYALLHTVKMVSHVDKETRKARQARQFKIYSAPPDKYHTCKGGKLPPEIVIPDGKNAFEILNQYWKIKE